MYLFEGGNFIWPGIRVGHNITLETGDDTFGEITLTTLSLQVIPSSSFAHFLRQNSPLFPQIQIVAGKWARKMAERSCQLDCAEDGHGHALCVFSRVCSRSTRC